MKHPDLKDIEEKIDDITWSPFWWILVIPDIYELVEQKIESMETKDLVSTIVSALIARKAMESLQWTNALLQWEIGELKQQIFTMKKEIDIFDIYEWTLEVDTLGNILSVNDFMVELSWYSREELLWANTRIMSSWIHSKEFWENFWTTLNAGKIWAGDICNKKKDGTLYWLLTFIIPKIDETGKIINFKVLRQDVSEAYTLKKQLKEPMGQKIDLLTGLPNNQKCLEDCARESNRSIALLHIKNMFDINNAFGREKGDDIIKSLAKVLVKFTSGNKHGVYKFEWVDFGMIFEDGVNEEYIREQYEKLRDFKVFDKNNKRIFLSFSLGIVLNEPNIKKLISHWYLALNASKKVRKHVIFDQKKHTSKKSEDFFEMGTLVREAFQEDLFEVHVQEYKKNSCSIQTDTVRKFECLVRMYDSKEKTRLLSPGVFLETIKDIWENQRLTSLIIEKVCIFMSQNEHHYSINLTEDDLRSKDFATSIHKKIQTYNIQPERITFEILEEIENMHFEHILENIQILKKLGYGIAIDDFWTKFATFKNLFDIRPNILKIDMSFIRWIHENKEHKSVVRLIVGFAHENEIVVVGEGVETREEQLVMEELWVDYSQGYLHDKPGHVMSK